METIDALREKCLQMTDDVVKGHMELDRATVAANLMGKVLSIEKLKQNQQAIMLTAHSLGLKLESSKYLGNITLKENKKCLPKE